MTAAKHQMTGSRNRILLLFYNFMASSRDRSVTAISGWKTEGDFEIRKYIALYIRNENSEELIHRLS